MTIRTGTLAVLPAPALLVLGFVSVGPAIATDAAPVAAPDPAARAVFVPPPAKEGFAYPDCYCTDSDGDRVDVGERACLRVGGRNVTALCDMSLNNPTWRTEAQGCPTS